MRIGPAAFLRNAGKQSSLLRNVLRYSHFSLRDFPGTLCDAVSYATSEGEPDRAAGGPARRGGGDGGARRGPG